MIIVSSLFGGRGFVSVRLVAADVSGGDRSGGSSGGAPHGGSAGPRGKPV